MKLYRSLSTSFWSIVLFLLLFQIHELSNAQVLIFATNSIPNKTPENLNIYLLIGQSNMAGRAAVRKEDSVSLKGSYLFTGDSIAPWVTSSNLLNRYSSV
jgi:hypothetical protein